MWDPLINILNIFKMFFFYDEVPVDFFLLLIIRKILDTQHYPLAPCIG